MMGRANTSAAQKMKQAAAMRAKRMVMGNLRSEEGNVASHFAGESSNIRCGKSETCAYIRKGRALAKASTRTALLQTANRSKRRAEMEEHENGTGRCYPDRYFVQQDRKS